MIKRYFFQKNIIENLQLNRKGFFTGIWNKNSLKYEWFLFFQKASSKFGYYAYRFTKSDYFKNFLNK